MDIGRQDQELEVHELLTCIGRCPYRRAFALFPVA
jgi:hypothetical protein